MSKTDVNTLLIFLIFLVACKENANEASKEMSADENKELIDNDQSVETANIEVYVWVDNLRLRSAATTDSEIVATLKEGEPLNFLHERSDFTEKINLRGTLFDEPWLKVITRGGVEGWVYGGGVKFYKIGVDLTPTVYDDCFLLQKNRKFTQARKCFDRTRFKELKKESSLVRENHKGIDFTLLGGDHFFIKNQTDTIYKFQYYLKEIAVFVVHVQYKQGEAYLLVNDKTGEMIRVKGFPRVSPDKMHIACLNTDWSDQGRFNGIQILGFKNRQLAILFEEVFTDYHPMLPKWIDEATLQFTLTDWGDQHSRRSRYGQLTRNDKGKWNLDL